MLQVRHRKGQFWILYSDLRHHPEKCFGYTRMSIASFDTLLEKLRDGLKRKDTNYRRAISPTERLLITLRFLATGQSYAALHYQYRMGRSTIRYLVLDTCTLLWNVLQPDFMPTPDSAMWESNIQMFWDKHRFPNCLGAVDGKHVRVVMPARSGSVYYNYKKYFSLNGCG
ncbi:putative nuclease HARBI1 [Hyperolius riggenbachi]|uniref:putative nuclease HARBI1 n=1 Tax=Hyperolius riggenbachi TaxID=752182 RepID=UPI0035A2825A